MRLFKLLFGAKDKEFPEARLERLELGMRRLEEEWDAVYDKFRLLSARVAKRVQRLESSSEEEPQRAEGDASATSATSLSPRLQRIQEQILARRGNRTLVTKEGE